MTNARDYEVASSVYPDPRILYDKDEYFYESPYRLLQGPSCGVATLLFIRACRNRMLERPKRAGLQLYLLYAMGGAVLGYFTQKLFDEYYINRDLVHKHYILTHPDDFPAPPKKKIAELFEPWKPIR